MEYDPSPGALTGFRTASYSVGRLMSLYPELATTLAMAEDSGYMSALNDQNPITFFAPNEGAWSRMNSGTKAHVHGSDSSLVYQLLQAHTSPSRTTKELMKATARTPGNTFNIPSSLPTEGSSSILLLFNSSILLLINSLSPQFFFSSIFYLSDFFSPILLPSDFSSSLQFFSLRFFLSPIFLSSLSIHFFLFNSSLFSSFPILLLHSAFSLLLRVGRE
jgi:hypothetical protein